MFETLSECLKAVWDEGKDFVAVERVGRFLTVF